MTTIVSEREIGEASTGNEQPDERCEAHGEQRLLPRIPNDVTLDFIVPRLPWREFYNLASVSRGWHHAILSRKVYDERVRSHSTETFIVIRNLDFLHKTALWCLRDGSFRDLPPIPHLHGWVPESSVCVALDGRIYVLGGKVDFGLESSRTVRMLEVAGAGQMQWKQQASMLESRRNFGCGALDGKIYVFGGRRAPYGVEVVCGSEVYDPNSDTWSPIAQMKFARYGHDVAVMGEELVVYGGKLVDASNHHQPAGDWRHAEFLEVYHPVKDEWRVVEPFVRPEGKRFLFMAQGKFHSMNDRNILVHDFDGDSWTHLHTHSLAAVEKIGSHRVDFVEIWPHFLLAVDNELLALVEYPNRDRRSDAGSSFCRERCKGSKLIRCRGLGSENKEIAWRAVRKWSGVCPIQLMCPIQL